MAPLKVIVDQQSKRLRRSYTRATSVIMIITGKLLPPQMDFLSFIL
jgi:hypothetical protein